MPARLVAFYLGRAVADVRSALTHRGVEVPYHVEADGAYLEFFSPGPSSVYTDESVYWLDDGASPAVVGDDDPPSSLSTATTIIRHTGREEQNIPGLILNPDPERDYWFWRNIVGPDTSDETRVMEVALDVEPVPTVGSGTRSG